MALGEGVSENTIQQAAAQGVQTPSTRLPFLEKLQPLFGHHDLGQVQAHVGSAAAATAMAMNARAYASGVHVVFSGTPDLRTAAHEAAHVVQQRTGVQLVGGVGQVGDKYEQHADAVAERAASGQSAEGLLQQFAGGQGEGSGLGVKHPHPPLAQSAAAGHPPANQAAAALATGVVQRVVLSRVYQSVEKGKTVTRYYSTYNSSEQFETREEAEKEDAKWRGTPQPYNARYSTNFTYHQASSHNAISSVPQGPHSLSHSSLSYRLRERFNSPGFDLRILRNEQVLTKEQFQQQFQEEVPSGTHARTIEPANTDYALLYDKLEAMLGSEDYDKDLASELIMRLMQMNPYSAYGKRPQGRARMKYKNEREDAPFSKAFDSKAKFNKPEGYDAFKTMRQKLYPPEEPEEKSLNKKRKGVEEFELAAELENEDRKAKKIKKEEPSGSSSTTTTSPVVRLGSLDEAGKRSWNAGDRFEVPEYQGGYFVWRVDHIGGTPVSKSDIWYKLRGG